MAIFNRGRYYFGSAQCFQHDVHPSGPKLGKKRTAIPSPSLTFSVEEVKRVGKSVSPATTVNDTMCALIGGEPHPLQSTPSMADAMPSAGAFARYYQARGLHPEQMMMRVTMPINTRSPKAPIQMENAFTVVFKSLPLHLPTPRVCPTGTRSRAQADPIFNAPDSTIW